MPMRLHASSIILVTMLASGAVQAGEPGTGFHLERLSPRETCLEPGQSASYVLRIQNVGTTAAVAHVGDGGHSSYPWLDDFTSYSLTQSDGPGCSAFDHEYTGFFNDYRIVFNAGPIAAGDHIDCTMTVGRDADSRHDMAVSWGIRTDVSDPPVYEHYTDAALFGTLTDVSIETRSFDFFVDAAGFAHATTELRIHNGGSLPIDPQAAGACEDNFIRPFITDGSGPDGCGSDQYAPTCFDWGYGFLAPEIAAGDTYRCLIHLTSTEPYESPLSFPIMVDARQSGVGYSFIDIDRQNNQASLRLEPDGTEVEAMPVSSMTRFGLIFLVSTVVLIARRALPTRQH